MSLLSSLDLQESGDLMNFNTGSLFDLPSGRYVPGIDGNWYLNGGLASHVNAVVGPNGAFKSTTACSFVMRSASIYKSSDVLIHDTENSLDKDKSRAYHMAEELYSPEIESRTRWIKGIDYTLGRAKDKKLETYDIYDVVKQICDLKETHRKDMIVETPFIDPKTNGPLKMWIPTYFFIDSLTELVTAIEEDALNGANTNFSDTNTVAMADGNKKTLFIHAMRKMCQKYGIVFVVTGHYDKVVQMDMYNPTPKETTFALRDYKTKGCGSKLKFLSSLYARTQAALLLDSAKEPLYACNSGGGSRDVMEVGITLERCKTANAGEVTPFVETQSEGLLNAVTNYHYLRIHDYYALNGNKQKQQVFLLPDVTISRNTIRQIASADAKLRRALEIAAQYCYIRNNWNVKDYPVRFDIEPQALFDKLNSDKNKNVINDILTSRGYWTFKGESDIPYMDLFRVLELAGATK
jgi:hypothetical protein